MELIYLHTGRSLTQSNYTGSYINTIVLLRMSTELLETCRGFIQTYYRRNCASSWSPTRTGTRNARRDVFVLSVPFCVHINAVVCLCENKAHVKVFFGADYC